MVFIYTIPQRKLSNMSKKRHHRRNYDINMIMRILLEMCENIVHVKKRVRFFFFILFDEMYLDIISH